MFGHRNLLQNKVCILVDIINYISKNFSKFCQDKRIRGLDKEELKLLLKYQDLYNPNKDEILLAISLWTYYNGNDDSIELLWNIDLKTVTVPTLLSVIRDYPNMREDDNFKEKLFEMGQEGEQFLQDFVKKF